MFDHPTPGAGFSQGLRRPPSRTPARRNARKRMASRTISVRMPRKLPPEPRLESPGRNRDGSRPAARVGRGSGAPRKQSPNRNPPAGRIHADRHPAAMPGLAERALFVASLPWPNRNCVFRRFTPAPIPDAQPDPLQVCAHGRCLSAVGRPCHVQCRLAHRRQVPWVGTPSVARAVLPDGCVRNPAKRVFRRPMRTRSPETARGHAFR